MDQYRFDPGASRFTVQAFATGLLKALGHSPTFAVNEFQGTLGLALDEGGPRLEVVITVRADSLSLLDHVKPADRAEIEERMFREVLETKTHENIAFSSERAELVRAAPGTYQSRIEGRLVLRGLARPQRVDVELLVFRDGVRLLGGCPLRMSEHQIKPVAALGGAIKLKDDLKVTFDLGAVPVVT